MPEVKDITEQNKVAWDELYQNSKGLVWGKTPIPFVVEFVDKLAETLSDSAKALDAATGEGRHLPVLLRLNAEIHACDASESALAKLKTIEGSFTHRQCDLAETGYPDNSFDLITLVDTVETLPNANEVLLEMRRILKPGGYLLCNIPGPEDEISEENMEPVETGDEGSCLYQDLYYYHFYEEGEALELVSSLGFEVVENVIRHWSEGIHPGFRDHPHDHTSRVFLLTKPFG